MAVSPIPGGLSMKKIIVRDGVGFYVKPSGEGRASVQFAGLA
jgi:hypothetical protein